MMGRPQLPDSNDDDDEQSCFCAPLFLPLSYLSTYSEHRF